MCQANAELCRPFFSEIQMNLTLNLKRHSKTLKNSFEKNDRN